MAQADVQHNDPADACFGRHLLAMLIAAIVLVMILFGASVTTGEHGDSDPTWNPLKFWEWFVVKRPGGLYYELNHRCIGVILGVLVFLLAGLLWLRDRRVWMRRLAVALVALVCAQGALGGLRVHEVSNPAVREFLRSLLGLGMDLNPMVVFTSMVHATLAQVVFCAVVAIALATSGGWLNRISASVSEQAPKLRRLAVLTTALVFAQLILGTYVRHNRTFEEGAIKAHAVLIHAVGALLVTVHVILLARRCAKHHYECFSIRQVANLTVFMVGFQLFLGICAWLMSAGQAATPPMSLVGLIRTGHVATGAMILAMCTVMTLRSFHLVRTNVESLRDGIGHAPETGAVLQQGAGA